MGDVQTFPIDLYDGKNLVATIQVSRDSNLEFAEQLLTHEGVTYKTEGIGMSDGVGASQNERAFRVHDTQT